MRSTIIGVLLALVAATTGWGQVLSADQLVFRGRVPPMPSGVVAQATGALGSTNLYYWVTARFPAGVTTPAGPARATNTVGIAALAPGSSVRIAWQAVAGATGYDVIRQAQPQFPTNGQCVNCVVASDTAALTFNDVGGAVVNWPTAGTVPARSTTLPVSLNNRDDDYPFLAVGGELHFLPTRRPTGSAGYGYLFGIGGLMTGTTAEKTYALGITVGRPPTSIATGDSNDAIFRGSYSNYAANDNNFVLNGINTTVSNRLGNVGVLQGGNVYAGNRSGATAPFLRGLYLSMENFGVVTDEFSGLTVALKNEGAVASLEYGVKVLNDNASLATAVGAAYMIRSSGALKNLGFQYGMDMNGATIGTAELRTSVGNNLYSGNGAPAAGLCAAPTLGSIYLNLAGGAGTSFCVCEVAGAWACK